MFSKLKKLMSKKEGVLAWNTLMLYILTFSNYFLSLLVVPYETRVLKTAGYGELGVAMAIMVYFQLFIDFGFLLSATEEVSRNRQNHRLLSVVMTAVTCCKLALSLLSALVLFVLCQVIPAWQGKFGFYLLFFLGTAINAMLPDYLYRGLEKMSAITIRTVCIRAFSTLGIFLFLKSPEDIWVIPVLTAVGNLLAILACFYDAKKRLDVRFCRVSGADVWLRMKESSVFFLSRFATTAYSALNTIILDIVSPGEIAVAGEMVKNPVRGYYTSADKLMTTGKQALSPISDSLYPYMVKHHDYRLVKKVLLILEPIIFAGCTVIFLFAPQFCQLLFGEDFAPAGNVLRVMLPTAVVILPSYICGFPMLSSMGLAKHANYSTIFGSVIHVINLAVLYLTGNMSMITLGAAMSVAETLILAYRLVVIWLHRDRLKGDYHEQAS